MSRDIKFRGLGMNNKWEIGGYFKHTEENGVVHCIYTWETGALPVHKDTIGQFTGLKDKNGVDIYEGDIINSGTGEILWSDIDCMFKVKWHGEIFKRVRGQNEKYTLNGEPLFMNAHIAWQVIGNIHENSELLCQD